MRRNLFFALLANIVNAGFSWLLLLYLARFGTKGDVGLLALAQALALPVHMFFTLKMRTIQATDFENKFSNQDYVSARVLLSIINLFFVLIVSLVVYEGNNHYIFPIFAFGVSYSLAIVREYYISIMQQVARNDALFISNMVQGSLGVAAFGIMYAITNSVADALLALALSRVPAMYLDDIICSRFTSVSAIDGIKGLFKSWIGIRELIIKSFPLGIVAIIAALFTSIPRYYVEKYSGLEQLGIYATVMSLVVVLNIFANSFGQAVLPDLARMYAKDVGLFMRKILKALFFVILLLVVFMFFVDAFSSQILLVAFGDEYTAYSNELYWAMISGCALVLFHLGNLILNAQKNYKIQVYIYAGCALITIGASIVLVKEYGLMGAIAATIICSLIGFLLSVICFWRYRLKCIN